MDFSPRHGINYHRLQRCARNLEVKKTDFCKEVLGNKYEIFT